MTTEQGTSAKTFYKEKLVNQLKNNCCENQGCVEWKKEKYSQRLELQEKLRRNEAAISTCQEIILEKNKSIEECEEKLKVFMNGSEKSTPNKEKDQHMLAAFEEIGASFTSDQLTDLCAFNLDSKKDAPFMTAMIKFSHKDLSELKTKSFTGNSKSNVEKTAISPAKLLLWKNMLKKRLQYSGTRDSVARFGKFRSLVNNSIQHLAKGTKISKIHDCLDEDRIAVIISNSENDLIVVKNIHNKLSVEDLKVFFSVK